MKDLGAGKLMPEGVKQFCKWSILILSVVIIFLEAGILAFGEEQQKTVLILNSYHNGLTWTDGETQGIVSALKSSGMDCSISIEYMDWKNYSSQNNLEHLFTFYKYKYSKKHIDLVITTDDAALKFALENRQALFSDAPVVFCGVNEKGVKKLLQGYSNVTGVVEQVDPEGTVRSMLHVNPGLRAIYVLVDNSESGLSTGDLTAQVIKNLKPDIEIKILNNKALKDILAEVGKAEKDSALLIGTFYSDVQGVVVGFENITRMVSQSSKVPVYHLYDFGLGNGAIGGSMLSGKLQGENAGRIAVKVLKGENISDIPLQSDKTTRNVFDYKQMERFHISPASIPKGSEIINKPFSFFEEYKSLVVAVSIVFLMLIAFICILLFYLKKISRMKTELHEKHVELRKLYEELSISENHMKRQFEELTRVQNELVSSENRYSLLFEKTLNGFFILEPIENNNGILTDIRFLDVNPGFEIQTGAKAWQILGKTWLEVFKYPNRDLRIYQRILQTGEAQHFETYYPDGDIYYLANAFKISDNRVGVVFDNITEYKKAIKEVRKFNEELEHRIADRTSELRNAVSELEAFVYTVSHDLKSPLRAVDGYSRIILEDYEEKIEGEAGEMLTNIRSICKQMIDMINKLLQYSTTSKMEIYKEEVNVEETVSIIFNELKSSNPDRSIILNIETGLPKVLADKILLRQVIHNIMSNAFKFTKDRDKAVISIGSTITDEEYIFYFRDNGAGFDMEFSGKLFGLFQRLHTNDEFEGTGIGLVTIKKIIQKHGGRCWIEGKVDEGATVYFSLPLSWN